MGQNGRLDEKGKGRAAGRAKCCRPLHSGHDDIALQRALAGDGRNATTQPAVMAGRCDNVTAGRPPWQGPLDLASRLSLWTWPSRRQRHRTLHAPPRSSQRTVRSPARCSPGPRREQEGRTIGRSVAGRASRAGRRLVGAGQCLLLALHARLALVRTGRPRERQRRFR